ncbi:MAG: hypothetical protein ABIS17_15960 [Casimicrobiaceae bacterium]
MADYNAPPSTHVVVVPEPPITATLVAYALFGVGAVATLISAGFPVALPLFGLLGIIGVIIAYVKRDDAQGTWVASHLRWLIRTFWYSMLWGFVGVLFLLVLGIILIGIPIAFLIWALASIWVIYRVIRGFLLFNGNRPVPGM